METIKVKFLPGQVEVAVPPGRTVMEAAVEAGVELEGPCGGKGTCGKCRVKVNGEWVLACRTAAENDMVVEVPQAEVSLYRKSELTQRQEKLEVAPGIRPVLCRTEPPSLKDQAPDAARLARVLNGKVSWTMGALRSLPAALREGDYTVTALLQDAKVLAVQPGNANGQVYGLAVDIGTTTVVGMLVELTSGETVAIASATNTQNIFGADVISRIEYAMQEPRGLAQLQRRVAAVINQLARQMTKANGAAETDIYLAAVVGNTTMTHLFMGTDPTYLASSPFIPVVANLVEAEARDFGLNFYPHAPVFVLPNIAGYVGADTVGVILATGIDGRRGNRLAVDIGTNGEIVLACNGDLSTCSTAAGPAFEGAQILFGMRAATGAIEGVRIDEDVSLKVIGDAPAKGICGSGLMDAVSQMRLAGLIDEGGRLLGKEQAAHLPPALQARLKTKEFGNCFVLSAGPDGQEVVLTQKDIRELQLAKAAVRAGIQILLREAGLTWGDLDEVLLAGAFGSYINKKSALTIRLLPQVAAEKILSVGNAAGAGAKMALLSAGVRERAVRVAGLVKHVELSTRQDFQEEFMDALCFAE